MLTTSFLSSLFSHPHTIADSEQTCAWACSCSIHQDLQAGSFDWSWLSNSHQVSSEHGGSCFFLFSLGIAQPCCPILSGVWHQLSIFLICWWAGAFGWVQQSYWLLAIFSRVSNLLGATCWETLSSCRDSSFVLLRHLSLCLLDFAWNNSPMIWNFAGTCIGYWIPLLVSSSGCTLVYSHSSGTAFSMPISSWEWLDPWQVVFDCFCLFLLRSSGFWSSGIFWTFVANDVLFAFGWEWVFEIIWISRSSTQNAFSSIGSCNSKKRVQS